MGYSSGYVGRRHTAHDAMAAAEEEKALLGGDTAKVLEFNEVSFSRHDP